MEKLFEWVKTHRTLAIIGGAGLLVLLWLMLRGGGSSAPQEGGGSALTAYYAAQAAASGDAAEVSQSTNALAASTNQTNAAADVAKAQIAASLEGTKLAVNQAAYQDYLAERVMSGPASSGNDLRTTFTVGSQTIDPGGAIWGEATNAAGTKTLWQGVMGLPSSLVLVNPQTGEVSHNNEVPGTWSYFENGIPARLVTWSGTPGDATQAYVKPATPSTMTFADFMKSLSAA